MEIDDRARVPALLLNLMPESREKITVRAGLPIDQVFSGGMEWFQLYDFLDEVLRDGTLLPELRRQPRDEDLVRRCFDFVEILLRGPDLWIRSAADPGRPAMEVG